jgi:hypothetical protein
MAKQIKIGDEGAEVTISVKEYESLLKDADLMRKLEAAGVDNWEGWYIWEEYED